MMNIQITYQDTHADVITRGYHCKSLSTTKLNNGAFEHEIILDEKSGKELVNYLWYYFFLPATFKYVA